MFRSIAFERDRVKTILKILGLAFLLVVIGCKPSVNYNSTYSVKVDAYETKAENVALIADLSSYDLAYLMSHFISYDPEEMSGAIRLGHHIPTDEGANPSYRMTLDLRNKFVREKKNALKWQFESYIPQLLETHLSKKSLFEELEEPARKWMYLHFEGQVGKAYDQGAILLKDSSSRDEYIEQSEAVLAQFGELESIRFLRGLYYENFYGQPEVIQIIFEQQYLDGRKRGGTVSMLQENGKWLPGGVRL